MWQMFQFHIHLHQVILKRFDFWRWSIANSRTSLNQLQELWTPLSKVCMWKSDRLFWRIVTKLSERVKIQLTKRRTDGVSDEDRQNNDELKYDALSTISSTYLSNKAGKLWVLKVLRENVLWTKESKRCGEKPPERVIQSIYLQQNTVLTLANELTSRMIKLSPSNDQLAIEGSHCSIIW